MPNWEQDPNSPNFGLITDQTDPNFGLTIDQASAPVEPGNIDVNKLPAVPNPDGTVSTVKSFSIGTDKGEVLIPQVVDGKLVSKDEAIQHFRNTGQHLGIFSSPDAADAYAQRLHESEAQRVGPDADIQAMNAERAKQGLPPLEVMSGAPYRETPEPKPNPISSFLDQFFTPAEPLSAITGKQKGTGSLLPIKDAREDLKKSWIGKYMGPDPKPGTVTAALDNIADNAVEGLTSGETLMSLPMYELWPYRLLAAAQALSHGGEEIGRGVAKAQYGQAGGATQDIGQGTLDTALATLLSSGKIVPKRGPSQVDKFFRDYYEPSPAVEKISEKSKEKVLEATQATLANQEQQATSDLPATLNVGANIGDARNALKAEQLLQALKSAGIDLSRKPYLKGGGEEPTWIVNPTKPVSVEAGNRLARETGQQAIPQYGGGSQGEMFVPEPEKLSNPEWGKFNPDYFQALDERGNPAMLNDLLKRAKAGQASAPAPHEQPLAAPHPEGLSDEQHQQLSALEERAANLQNQVGDYLGKDATPEKYKLQDDLWKTFDQIHKIREQSGQPRDFVIIGGGPAGLKAAAHASYEGLDTVVLEKSPSTGGAAKRSQEIVNTGATDTGATGRDYFRPRTLTAKNRGAQIRTGVEVRDIRPRPDGGVDVVTNTGEVIPARRALIATGSSFNYHPGFDLAGYGNAERLVAKTKGKEGLVYGGGNSATQAVIGAIRNGAKKITIMSRHDLAREASADQVRRLEALQKEGKVNIVTDEIKGLRKGQDGQVIVDTKGGKSIPVAHVETFLDSNLNTGWLPKGIEKVNLPSRPGRPPKPGPVKVLDASLKSTMPGVYVGGDIRESLPGENRPRRIDMAEGDAAGIAARVVNDVYSFRKNGRLPEWKAAEAQAEPIDQTLKSLKEPPSATTTGTTPIGKAAPSTPKQSNISSETSQPKIEKTESAPSKTVSTESSRTSESQPENRQSSPESVGISRKAVSEQTEAGRYGENAPDNTPGKGKGADELRDEGIAAAKNGEPINEAVFRLQQAGHDMARLRAEYERRAYETNKAQAAYMADRTPEKRAAYDAAQKAEADFFSNTVGKVGAPVSDALRAFQGRAEPEADTFEGLSRIARAKVQRPLTIREEGRLGRILKSVQVAEVGEQRALKSLSMSLQKTPIRSNRRVLETPEMRDMMKDLKEKLTPCQK